MNVMQVVESLNPEAGGPARSVPSLGEAIQRVGADVQLYVNNKEMDSASDRVTQTISLPINPIRKLNATVQELREQQANNLLIHNHGIWLPLNHHACVTAKRFNIPLIISPRGMLEPWALSYRSWKKTIAWHLYQRRDLQAATVLHATSKQEAKNIQSLGFHLPIAMIPNGVNIPDLLKPPKQDQKLKTALFLSRVHPKKGLINLVHAWAKVCPANWRVIIAGPDESGHRAEVEQVIKQLGLTNIFKCIGSVKDQDKWELYSQSDLFILPTYSENFGIVIAEALACGTPVITTKGAPWAELDEHKCGWWIDIGIDPLQKAISEAVHLSVEERQNMGKRGQKLIKKKYSWNQIGHSMLAVYSWMLDTDTPPACMIIDK